jgi:preprotein translocase subunit SecA
MLSNLKSLFDFNQRQISKFQTIVNQINRLETSISSLTDAQLAGKTSEFKAKLSSGTSLDQLLPEAYAVVREAIKRVIGERAYDVQLIAAIALHQGAIAEQKTGEGKTHSVIFPAYLNALAGQGVHVVTPNDYLTRVGAGWYPRALHFLGITTAAIIHEQSFILDPEFTDPSETVDLRLSHLKPISRREAYLADITYGTNHEFGFDYLRDHMVAYQKEMVQRPPFFAIVDEVDFVLIDEARTPLIISSPNNQPTDKYYQFAQIASQLQTNDYIIDEKSRSATLSEYGIRKVERVLGVKNLYEESFDTIHYIENAIKAKTIFRRDKDYVVKDGEIIIVDEFTGRLMHGRRWSDGLHQAVEAKEGVTVQKESQTWATITFQNYFRLYQKLAGMTGTAATEAEEFRKIYNLEVISIPTHRPIARLDDQDLIFKTQRSKYAAIANLVSELHQKGQPVLIGTTSIEKNQIISSLLTKKGLPHQVLNAKNHRSEAEIIAKAGTKGAITVATNMAGRGVDIILGGPKESDPHNWDQKHQEVIDLGGLYVIGTERHESRRIDNQLRGRAGRQGDPGHSQFYVALDDDLMRIFGGDRIQALMTRFNMPEDTPLTHPMVSKALEQIQIKVEGYNFDVRKNLVEYDDVINKQRQIVYQLRETALDSAAKDDDRNRAEVFKAFDSQLQQIISQGYDEAGQVDPNKIALEFSEILPLDEKQRTALESEIAQSSNPYEVLSPHLQNSWQQRLDFFGPQLAQDILRFAIISTIDPLWVEHLTALDDLRDGVRLRGYAQRDPLIEYRKEGYEMFQNLMGQYQYNLARKIFRLQIETAPATPVAQLQEFKPTADTPANTDSARSENPPVSKTIVSTSTLNRNDPCWCGSGKKWKKCHYPNLS